MRIYADFNGLGYSPRAPERLVVPLDTYGSLCDLADAGVILTDGMALTIFDQSDENEDLEADAFAHFDSELKCWVAEIDEKGYRYIPTHGAIRASLVCVKCRSELESAVRAQGLTDQTTCPTCGALARLPVLPPTPEKQR